MKPMSMKERILAMIRRQPHDRVPFAMYDDLGLPRGFEGTLQIDAELGIEGDDDDEDVLHDAMAEPTSDDDQEAFPTPLPPPLPPPPLPERPTPPARTFAHFPATHLGTVADRVGRR